MKHSGELPGDELFWLTLFRHHSRKQHDHCSDFPGEILEITQKRSAFSGMGLRIVPQLIYSGEDEFSANGQRVSLTEPCGTKSVRPLIWVQGC